MECVGRRDRETNSAEGEDALDIELSTDPELDVPGSSAEMDLFTSSAINNIKRHAIYTTNNTCSTNHESKWTQFYFVLSPTRSPRNTTSFLVLSELLLYRPAMGSHGVLLSHGSSIHIWDGTWCGVIAGDGDGVRVCREPG